jgi:HlyD family secretion protein
MEENDSEQNKQQRISSSGMDKKIDTPTWTWKRISALAVGLLVIGTLIYGFVFLEPTSTLNVDREKLSISTVNQGTFQEFIQVTGAVQPIRSVYLDAVEGGVIEAVNLESGTRVQRGDTILTLSNSDLRLQVLNQSSSLYDQINQTRNSRLNVEQNTLNLKERLAQAKNQFSVAQSNFDRQQKLYNKNLISEQAYLESQENFQYQKKRYNLFYESFKQDSIKSRRQLQQIDQSLDRMRRNLQAVQKILDRLVVTAPISGQLSTIELNPGQSISSGERIGQIDVLSNYKVRVNIDEYHLSRVTAGLQGTVEIAGESQALKITKVYPVVENGQFQVDMEFMDAPPTDLSRGQSLRIRLQLGQSSEASLLARGGFYQSTGGNWVYKIVDGGDRAVRRQIDLGRQNPEYFEVLSGLEAGDKIITSSYDSFGENQELNLQD